MRLTALLLVHLGSPNKEDQKVKDFRKAYVAKYGKEPDQFAAQAYDAVYLYEAALKKAGSTTDREKFREALKTLLTSLV